MASASDGRPGGRVSRGSGELVRLITRLLVAQAVTTAVVGLPFSRRQLPPILITVGMVAVVSVLAAASRTGARPAWAAILAFEAAFFLFGLLKFMFDRYVGGTLFALITAGALVHPAVARAYGVRWPRPGRAARSPSGPGESVPEPFTGETFGEENFGGHPVG